MASFVTVIAFAFLISLIRVLGYGFVAEKIHWIFQKVFGRSAYAAYLRDWKELRKVKQELSSISPQDEFAKWARLQRNVDKMQADFDRLHSSRKRQAAFVEFVLSMAVRVALYCAVSWYGIWHGIYEPVDDLTVSKKIFGPFTGYLAMPYMVEGQMSVAVLMMISVVAFKHLFESMKPAAAASK